MINRIDHFVLTVADVDATLDFYERVLSFRRKLTEGQPAALLFGGQKINIHQAGRTFEPIEREGAQGKMTSIYFRDPDRNLIEVVCTLSINVRCALFADSKVPFIEASDASIG